MKKCLILILTIFVVAIVIFVLNYKEFQMNQVDLKKFNLTYEEFNKEKLNGLDITTVMNKATSNNEKYQIPKEENGIYLLDDEWTVVTRDRKLSAHYENTVLITKDEPKLLTLSR